MYVSITDLFNSGAAKVLGDGDGGADDPFESQFVDVEGGSVAVHEHHCGGEVEEARGEDAEAGPRVEGFAGVQTLAVEVEAAVAPRKNHHREKGQRGHPGEAHDGHAALRRDQWSEHIEPLVGKHFAKKTSFQYI